MDHRSVKPNQIGQDNPQADAKALGEISEDLFKRYTIHSKRIYLAAASHHAPMVNDFAASTPGTFAGVILASAAFPGARLPRSVPHPIFAAVGLDDGNWTRLRRLDFEMKSPHRVMIFEKRATWMPTEIATNAVEWHELRAMRSGLRVKDKAVIARLFDERAAATQKLSGRQLWDALRAVGEDFEELDARASAFRERAQTMLKDNAIQQDFKRERIEQTRQRTAWQDFLESHGGLTSNERRPKSLAELEFQLSELLKESKRGNTLSDRLVASRTLDAILSRPVKDPDYMKILNKLGLR